MKMADDDECEVVVSNGQVFVERRGGDFGGDPNSILQNVEQTCSKIMIPSMAESAVSAMTKSDPHPDVIFSTLKEVSDAVERGEHQQQHHQHDEHDHDHDEHEEEDGIVIKSELSQVNVPKWNLIYFFSWQSFLFLLFLLFRKFLSS